MLNHKKFKYIWICIILLCSSCIQTRENIQTYPGPVLSSDKHAILEVNKDLINLGIQSVDDKLIHSYSGGSIFKRGVTTDPVYLLPGNHKIGLSFTSSNAIERRFADATLSCNFESGQIYIAQLRTDQFTHYIFWIEEKTTRKIIARSDYRRIWHPRTTQ